MLDLYFLSLRLRALSCSLRFSDYMQDVTGDNELHVAIVDMVSDALMSLSLDIAKSVDSEDVSDSKD